MALSRFTTYVGYALDKVNAQLSSSVIATATSLPITNGNGTTPLATSGASYSAIIIDGPLTETVALTGNLSGGAVPCAATANAHSEFVYIVFQLTSSVGPSTYFPLETFKPSDAYDQLYDMAVVGSLVDNRGAVAGVRTSTWDIGGAFFADTFPYFLGAVNGAEDYTPGSPNLHAFSVNNSVSTLYPAQPARVIIYNYDGYNTRLFCGRVTDVGITFDPKQLIKFTAKFLGRASGVVANPTKAFSAIVPLPSWTGYATIGGSDVGKILTADITFSRGEVEAIPTLSGIQDPWDIFLGALSTKGKFSLVFDDDTQQSNYYNETQPTVQLKFTRGTGASQQYLLIHMASCNYDKADITQQGKSYVTNDIEFTGIGNSTDATAAGTGLSTSKVTVANAVASGTTYT